MNHSTSIYLTKVRHNLRCRRSVKQALYKKLIGAVSMYLEENPDPTEDDLVSAFGTPQAMARTLMENIEQKDKAFYHRMNISKRIVWSVALASFLLFSIYVLFAKEFPHISVVDEGYTSKIYITME